MKSVSISGDRAIVGALLEDTGGSRAGAAYIFERDGSGTWSEVQKIQASDKEADDFFGRSVSISGDRAIVGAEGEDTGGSLAGAAYIFEGLIDIAVDIKPQGCPNPLNTNNKGVIPVATLGTPDFDVTQVDLTSILLAGVSPSRSNFEDVATPFEPFTGKEDCDFDCYELGPDSVLDLTMKFDAQELVAALGDVADGDCIVVTLTGSLMEAFGGTHFFGEDVLRIKKKK